MLACISSAILHGVEGRPVAVEVHVAENSLPGFCIVGLPDAAVRESRDRVRAALLSSGFSWPQKRVTVNLAPSGIKKGGVSLDLPTAVGVLVATGQLSHEHVENKSFVGELGLDGALRTGTWDRAPGGGPVRPPRGGTELVCCRGGPGRRFEGASRHEP